MVIRPQAQHAALQAARKLQRTETFQQKYALRRGVEAIISQGVRAFDLRRSRYVGLPKLMPTEYPAGANRTPY